MSTRKRSRPSLNHNDDEDELSPSKPTSAPLSSVKKRKLNTYGKSKGTSMLSKLGGIFGFGQPGTGKENTTEAEEKDELADEDGETEEEKEQGDIWEVPDEEEPGMGRHGVRGTPTSTAKGTPISQGKTGSAKFVKQNGSARALKKDIYDVEDSEEDIAVNSILRSKGIVEGTPQVSRSTSKSKKESEDSTPKRGRPPKQIEAKEAVLEPDMTPKRGRPSKQAETVVPSPKRSAGRPRKADILKKAKALSREAIFHQMMEAGKKAAAEESEEAQTSTRRRSGRAAQLEEEDDADTVTEVGELEASTSTRRRGRPKHNAVESIKEAPKGILTPSKNRTLKSKKSVAFEARDDIDLGFKDLPDSANKTSISKIGRKPKGLSQEHPEEPVTKVSAKTRKVDDLVEEIPQPEEEAESEDSDDEPCAVCKGLDSEKGNEMIFCDSCDFAVHLKCYDLPKVPRGDWFCKDCQPEDEDVLDLQVDDDVAVGDVFNDLPEIEGLEDHLRHMQRLLLDRLTGQKRIKLRGHDEEMRKVHQVVEQTVLAGEGNSVLVIGARGCGKTTLVESVISDLSTDHRENFHVVRLNGFIHTDDKLALKEIWRQLGREMDAEDEMTGKSNHADTLASLLALLSHPSEISDDRADQTAKSVVFVLDEFDLFTTHPRQTLLYNLFDIAQARKAPIVVLGLTTHINVVETLEKRVKSRFSHRYVHLSLPKSLPAFWEICKEGLLVESEDLGDEGFDLGISGQDEFVSFWQSMIDDLYNKDAAFKHHLQSHFYRSKSVPAFFTSCILPIANLSARSLPLTGRKFTSSAISLSAPDSKLHILQGLSELEVALLIAAARLDIILDTDTCNFAMAYDEYSSLTSRHKIQTSSAGVTALGASAKVWGRGVALGAWERLAEYTLLVPAGIGGGFARDFGAGGRMWKVDVGLEEITGSVESLSGVMAKWCREI